MVSARLSDQNGITRIYIVKHTLTLKFLNLDVMPTHIMQSQCNSRNQFIKIIQGMDTG